MTRDTMPAPVVEDLWQDLDSLCRAAGVQADWLRQRAAAGLLPSVGAGGGFDVHTLHHVRCMWRIERDFGAAPELSALVADLEAEIARLRSLLNRLA